MEPALLCWNNPLPGIPTPISKAKEGLLQTIEPVSGSLQWTIDQSTQGADQASWRGAHTCACSISSSSSSSSSFWSTSRLGGGGGGARLGTLGDLRGTPAFSDAWQWGGGSISIKLARHVLRSRGQCVGCSCGVEKKGHRMHLSNPKRKLYAVEAG